MSLEGLFESLFGVTRKDVGTTEQQAGNLRIALGHELDDQVAAQPAEIGGNTLERQVVSDRQVMHQRQREYRIGWTPFFQRQSFPTGPALPWRGIGQILQQR